MSCSYKYFSQSDFDSCIPPCNMGEMNQYTLLKLDMAREISGIPFIINSAYRAIDHELIKGRDGTSSHTKGVAVDIKAIGSHQRFLIVSALLEVGFTRIGIHERFIHADDDPNKDQQVIWFY